MMTPDQRYFFDLTGYLHLRDVLSQRSSRPPKRQLTAISTCRLKSGRPNSARTSRAAT